MLLEVFPDLPASGVFQYHVQGVLILEGLVQTDDEGVFDGVQDARLTHDVPHLWKG